MKKILLLNSFYLKIIAYVLITLDHIGLALQAFTVYNEVGLILRYIGRLALPIFLFLLIEGSKYTKNIYFYLLRIGIMAFIIFLPEFLIQMLILSKVIKTNIIPLTQLVSNGNIYIDLFLILLTIILIKNKNKYIKSLAIIPFLYSLACTIIRYLELGSTNNLVIYALPYGLRPQYFLYSYLIGILIHIANLYLEKQALVNANNNQVTVEQYKEAINYNFRYNLLACLCIVIISLLFTGLKYLTQIDLLNDSIQSYAILSILIIIFYNHKKGLSNKITKWIFYLYYPMHIALILLIFILL